MQRVTTIFHYLILARSISYCTIKFVCCHFSLTGKQTIAGQGGRENIQNFPAHSKVLADEIIKCSKYYIHKVDSQYILPW